MGNVESTQKEVGLAVGYSTSTVCVGGGIALMFLGPIGMVAGGIILGTGISSTTNTIQQNVSKEKNFKYGEWGISSGIGAAGGAVAAPFAAAGGVVASGLTSTAAKVATIVAAETVGGAVSNTTCTVIDAAANDKELTLSNVGTSLITGAVTGLVGAGVGQAAGSAVKKIGSGAAGTVGREMGNKVVTGARTVVKSVLQAAGAASGSALATFLENVITNGCITRKEFCKLFQDNDQETANEIWTFLIDNKIIVNDKVSNIDDTVAWDKFPADLEAYKEHVFKILTTACDLSRGVGEAAATGAAIGAAMGAIGHLAERHQLKKNIKAEFRSRAQNVRNQGVHAGTLEIEAYARSQNKRVVIHSENNSPVTVGSSSANKEVHMHFDHVSKHYTLADKAGKPIPTSSSHVPGDCVFEALASLHKEENSLSIRKKIADFMKRKTTSSAKDVLVSELSTGGRMPGGAARGDNRSQMGFDDYNKDFEIMQNYFNDVPHDEMKYMMEYIGKQTEFHLGKIKEFNDAAKNNQRPCRLHYIKDQDAFSASFGNKNRATFKISKGTKQLKLWGVTNNHEYKEMRNNFLQMQGKMERRDGKWKMKN